MMAREFVNHVRYTVIPVLKGIVTISAHHVINHSSSTTKPEPAMTPMAISTPWLSSLNIHLLMLHGHCIPNYKIKVLIIAGCIRYWGPPPFNIGH
jgi:hypothetical protein